MHFKVHPSVLFQLGESLITDVVQAVVELVKNAYDADATEAVVRIETTGNEMPRWSKFELEGGWIEVADNGDGMDRNDIEGKWLVVSNRSKLEQKQRRELTKRGRTPLGDKGLGRLGIQRLGHRVELLTKMQKSEPLHLWLDWRTFMGKDDLAKVDVSIEQGEKKSRGTQVVVSALRDVKDWSEEGIERLEDELGRIISPYRRIKDFTVTAHINGKQLQLGEIGEEIERLSRVHYNIDFDGATLKLHGKIRLDYLRPQKDANQAASFSALVDADQGHLLLEYLLGQPQAKALGLRRSKVGGWFVESKRELALGDIDKLDRIDGAPVSPGPFSGEVDHFDLGTGGQDRLEESHTFDSLAQFRKYVHKFSGVRVFRDGFGIKVPQDWVGLGKQWTSSGSYYGLKPANVIGYIAITARDNAVLEETTDREGFKDSPSYRNLLGLLVEWRRYTGDLQEFLRRGWLDFLKLHHARVAGLQHEPAIEEVSNALTQRVKTASNRVRSARSMVGNLKKQIAKAEQALDGAIKSLESGKTPEKVPQQLREGIKALKELIDQGKSLENDLVEASDLSAIEALGETLQQRIGTFKSQLNEVYHAVALGLSAEALAHELHAATERLIQAARKFRLAARKDTPKAEELGAFVESILAGASAIRRQLTHLEPGLKYLREQRDTFPLATFLAEFCSFHRDRLLPKKITLECSVPSRGSPQVRMNRGKLTQVLDNLIYNSEYWLTESARDRPSTPPTIRIVEEGSTLLVSDSGPGVSPTVESNLFEPFVTTKRQFEGRGLGLYICKQLLDSDQCSIRLSERRNERGRRFEFVVDLSGVQDAG